MGIKMRDGTGAQTGLGALTHLCLMRASWEPADLFHSADVTVLTVTFFLMLGFSQFSKKSRGRIRRGSSCCWASVWICTQEILLRAKKHGFPIWDMSEHIFSEVKKQFKSCK